MPAEVFLAGAIVFQIAAAVLAFKLVRVTGQLSAWILISIALVLMAVRRIIPFARAILGNGAASADPLNEFIGLLLSAFMVAGIAMIGPIFRKIFKSEKELKASERRFRSYFELPLVGVAIVSAEKRWITVNDRLCEMLEYTRQELAAMTMAELTYAEDVAKETAFDLRVAGGGSDGYTLDKRYIRKSGGYIWTSQAVRCVRSPAGTMDYFVVILQDITERMEAEEGLRHSIQEKEALLRELYHRTKNNMQIICAFLDLESGKCGDPRIIEEFNLIENRILSMSLVHDKLYVSRDLSSIDLPEYIEDLSRLLTQSYNASSDRIAFALDLGDHVHVPIDTAIPLGLILNELITNAIKHAFPGGRKGCIRVRFARISEELFELVIADDGIGLPRDFDFGNARGMGLRTVSALTEQLGGIVRFKVGSGSECRISFGLSRFSSRRMSSGEDPAGQSRQGAERC